MQTKYNREGADMSPVDITCLEDKLLNGWVYRLNFHPMKGFWFTEIAQGFQFDYTVYGLESQFIDTFVSTYQGSKGNLGALLNGQKGGGKTVTVKEICNKLNLPIILIESNFGTALVQLLSRIQQDVVILIDEYEKIFDSKPEFDQDGDATGGRVADSTMLSIMDGALSSIHRKVFLLTTNNLWINENMLQRPGRLLFVKQFGNLSRQVIEEIVDDKLTETTKHLRDDTVRFIAGLETITVDIVTSLLDFVNIQKKSLTNFEDILNVKKMKDVYDIFHTDKDGNETRVKWSADLNTSEENLVVGNYLYINSNVVGTITKDYDPALELITIELHRGGQNRLAFADTLDPKKKKDFKPKDGQEVTLRLQKVKAYYSSYGGVFA